MEESHGAVLIVRAMFGVTIALLAGCSRPPPSAPAKNDAPPRADAANTVASVPSQASAPPTVTGTWIWRCCGNRWHGVLVLTESGGVVRGALVNDESGTGQLIEGNLTGSQLTFARRWTADGAHRSQRYSLVVDRSVQSLEGTSVEDHAPGPPIDFHAERGFVDIERPFNGTEAPRAAAPPPPPPPPHGGNAGDLFPRCNCKTYQCVCSGMPSLMNCHSECKCPACPPGIP
jgi:hypothetical protein